MYVSYRPDWEERSKRELVHELETLCDAVGLALTEFQSGRPEEASLILERNLRPKFSMPADAQIAFDLHRTEATR